MSDDDAPLSWPEELAAMPADDPYPRSKHGTWEGMFLAAVAADDGPAALWALSCSAGVDHHRWHDQLAMPDVVSPPTARAIAAYVDHHGWDDAWLPAAVVDAIVERHHDIDVLASQGPSAQLAGAFDAHLEHDGLPWILVVGRHLHDPAWSTADGPTVAAWCTDVFQRIDSDHGRALWAAATADLLHHHALTDLTAGIDPRHWIAADRARAVAAVDAGFDVVAFDWKCESFLDLVIKRGDADLLRHILATGVDPNQIIGFLASDYRDDVEYDALWRATSSRHSHSTSPLLLDAGAHPFGRGLDDNPVIAAWRDKIVAAGPSARLGRLVYQAADVDATPSEVEHETPPDYLGKLAADIRAHAGEPAWRDASPEAWAAFRGAAMEPISDRITDPGGVTMLAAVSAAIDVDDRVQTSATPTR